jgi:hypothetical protein
MSAATTQHQTDYTAGGGGTIVDEPFQFGMARRAAAAAQPGAVTAAAAGGSRAAAAAGGATAPSLAAASGGQLVGDSAASAGATGGTGASGGRGGVTSSADADPASPTTTGGRILRALRRVRSGRRGISRRTTATLFASPMELRVFLNLASRGAFLKLLIGAWILLWFWALTVSGADVTLRRDRIFPQAVRIVGRQWMSMTPATAADTGRFGRGGSFLSTAIVGPGDLDPTAALSGMRQLDLASPDDPVSPVSLSSPPPSRVAVAESDATAPPGAMLVVIYIDNGSFDSPPSNSFPVCGTPDTYAAATTCRLWLDTSIETPAFRLVPPLMLSILTFSVDMIFCIAWCVGGAKRLRNVHTHLESQLQFRRVYITGTLVLLIIDGVTFLCLLSSVRHDPIGFQIAQTLRDALFVGFVVMLTLHVSRVVKRVKF